jgi:hypothetical protein
MPNGEDQLRDEDEGPTEGVNSYKWDEVDEEEDHHEEEDHYDFPESWEDWGYGEDAG